MKPLVVLLISCGLALLILHFLTGAWPLSLAGRIAMALMLLFTGSAHFAFSKGMTMMVPSFVPFPRAMVVLTGFLEIAAAVGLLIPSLYKTTGWLLIIFLLLVLPANINAALHSVNYRKGTNTGDGRSYLWFRVPLQLFFILWVWFFAVQGTGMQG